VDQEKLDVVVTEPTPLLPQGIRDFSRDLFKIGGVLSALLTQRVPVFIAKTFNQPSIRLVQELVQAEWIGE
jgi:hypothetical protein